MSNLEISAPFQPGAVAVETKECINPLYQPRWEVGKVLVSHNLAVIRALEKAVQITDFDTISVALVTLFRQYHQADKLLHYFINKEIQETTEAATLFRGVSLTTKMVSAFCMQEGQAYCKNILAPCLKMFCADEVSVEVDPSKLIPGEDLEINQQKLLGVSKGLLNHITRSVDHCSLGLRKMFLQTRRLVAKKFPEHHLRVVGGFYFLRFLCPALVCPEGFGLIPGPPAAKSRRSLILLSKIVQNLANDVEFGEKELYMIKANPFIKTNQTTMWSFLEQLTTLPKNNHPSKFLELKTDPLVALLPCLTMYKAKIGTILQKEGQGAIFDELCTALDQYSSGTIKPGRPALTLHLPSDPTTPKRRPESPVPSSSSSSSSTPPRPTTPPVTSTPLSPTSMQVADLIPVCTSPSNSFSSLLQLDLSNAHTEEASALIEHNQQITTNNNNTAPEAKSEESNATPTEQGGGSKKKEVEEELKKEMQEIQALKLALEIGGMGLKEREEMQTRFAGLLQHIKVLLATYKSMKDDE